MGRHESRPSLLWDALPGVKTPGLRPLAPSGRRALNTHMRPPRRGRGRPRHNVDGRPRPSDRRKRPGNAKLQRASQATPLQLIPNRNKTTAERRNEKVSRPAPSRLIKAINASLPEAAFQTFLPSGQLRCGNILASGFLQNSPGDSPQPCRKPEAERFL